MTATSVASNGYIARRGRRVRCRHTTSRGTDVRLLTRPSAPSLIHPLSISDPSLIHLLSIPDPPRVYLQASRTSRRSSRPRSRCCARSRRRTPTWAASSWHFTRSRRARPTTLVASVTSVTSATPATSATSYRSRRTLSFHPRLHRSPPPPLCPSPASPKLVQPLCPSCLGLPLVSLPSHLHSSPTP